jgi:hypothetical protein
LTVNVTVDGEMVLARRSSLVARRSWQAVERKNERHLHAIVEQKRSKIPQFVMRIYSDWNNNCNCYCNCKFITGSTRAQLPVPGTGTRVYSFSYRTSPLRFADCDSMLSNSRLLASTRVYLRQPVLQVKVDTVNTFILDPSSYKTPSNSCISCLTP